MSSVSRRTPVALTALFMVGVSMLAASPARADHHDGARGSHSGHDAGHSTPAGGLSEASKAYDAAMQKMHQGMAIPYTNDVDADFVRGMIPHHLGAIEQAEILLKYSKNPRLRRLAGGIIASQRREIRFMENWLKEYEKGAETGEMPEWLKNAPDTLEAARERAAGSAR
ncbi:MAG: DUF305 domain-containing protein [Hyphomicrobiaceae bacterium]|nr:DUF305 domain-containing protein [Hyphomicrobiaceae bacterium]